MKISELSSRSGVPVATVKFYVREGLVASGERTSANQVQYDETHVARLRLVRAFIDVGGLSVAGAKAVLAAIDDESLPFGVAVGVAAHSLPVLPASEGATTGRGKRDLEALIAERGWIVDETNAGRALTARVIDDYAALGREDLITSLATYADAAEAVAKVDIQLVAEAAGRADQTATVVIGTVLGDALFAGLRRIAHENAARSQFPVPPEGDIS